MHPVSVTSVYEMLIIFKANACSAIMKLRFLCICWYIHYRNSFINIFQVFFFSKPILKEFSDKKIILNICSEVNHSKSVGRTLNHFNAKLNNYRLCICYKNIHNIRYIVKLWVRTSSFEPTTHIRGGFLRPVLSCTKVNEGRRVRFQDDEPLW